MSDWAFQNVRNPADRWCRLYSFLKAVSYTHLDVYKRQTLDTAAIVKMTRTLAIIPVTLVLAFVRAKREGSGEGVSLKKVFPMFVLYFVLASVLTTVCGLPGWLVGMLKEGSKFFIVMAMAAIGVNTDIVKLIRTCRLYTSRCV